MTCKIARSQRLRLLLLGIAQVQFVRKETEYNGGLETEREGGNAAISPTMLQQVVHNFQK